MYAAVLFVGICNCGTVQPVVAVERTVFYRERAAGMYSALPYAISQVWISTKFSMIIRDKYSFTDVNLVLRILQVVVEVPYIFIQAAYYSIIVYAMMSFQWTAGKFFWFFFITLFSFLYFTYYGMMTVSITPNHQVASVFAAAFYALFNLFSGFFIPRPVSPLIDILWNIAKKNLKFLIKCVTKYKYRFDWLRIFRKYRNGGYGTTGSAL